MFPAPPSPVLAPDMDFSTASQRIPPAPTGEPVAAMAVSSSSDFVVLGVGVILAALYLFKDSIFPSSKSKFAPSTTSKVVSNGSGNPRDFVAKMKEGVRLYALPTPVLHRALRLGLRF